MKAMVLKKFGGPESFELQEIGKPEPGNGEVRVRVHATSVNPLDCQIRRGVYPDLTPLPSTIGHDVSGIVDAIGPGVSSFRPGDEVWYTPQIFGGPGSYAEYHVAHESIVAIKPSTLNHLEAAALTLAGGTVWEALVERARLTLGESVLVHGGAGGVGHLAIQVAKSCGTRVFTTVRAENADFVKRLGADVVIDYQTEDYVEKIMDETQGRGVDAILDTIGGDTLARSPLALSQLGRVITIVDIAQPQNLIHAWGKNAAYHFVFTRQNRSKLDELGKLVERRLLKPNIAAVFELKDIPHAHTFLEDRNNSVQGKIAIDVAASISEA